MDLEYIYLAMRKDMKDSLEMAKETDKELFTILMEEFITGIGRIIKSIIKVLLTISMEINIKEGSKMDSFTMKEFLSIIQDVFIKENTDWVRKKDRVNFN
jgi:hypothetical protein